MTHDAADTLDQPTWHAPSPLARVAAALAGVVLVLAIVAVTLGVALPAFIGMAVIAWWRRRSARPDTRVTRWLGAVIGTGLAAVALTMFGMLQAQKYTRSLTPAQREAVQRQIEARPPSAIERMLPSSVPNPEVDAQAEKLTGSKLFVIWATTMSATLGGAFVGLVVGSAAWAAATLALFGFTGRWHPPATRVAGVASADSPA